MTVRKRIKARIAELQDKPEQPEQKEQKTLEGDSMFPLLIVMMHGDYPREGVTITSQIASFDERDNAERACASLMKAMDDENNCVAQVVRLY